MPTRLDRATAAERLGVSERTLRTYIVRRPPGMPAFVDFADDGQLTVDEAEWEAWIASRPGPGKPKGAHAQGSPCQKCGLMVERRWRETRTGLGLLVCKPDILHVEELPEADLEAWLVDLAVPPKG